MLVNRLLPFHANQSVLITSCSSRSVFSIAKRSAFLFSLLPYWFSHDYAANRPLRSIAQLLLMQKLCSLLFKRLLETPPFISHQFLHGRSFDIFSNNLLEFLYAPMFCFLLSQDFQFVTSNLWFALLVTVRFVLHPPCFPAATRMIFFLVAHLLLR